MDPLVLLEVGGLAEHLAALMASVRPLPGVHALVLLEVSGVAEASAAVAAGVRLLARVAAQVDAQVVHATECLPTQQALMVLLSA